MGSRLLLLVDDSVDMSLMKRGWQPFIPLALFGLAVLPYLLSLNVPFHYDDLHSVVMNPHIQSLSNLGRFFVDPTCFDSDPDIKMYRPLLLVSYAYNIAWAGLVPWIFHLTNIILHGLTTVVVFLCLRSLVARRPEGVPGGNLLPGVGALFFALLPVHSEPVIYVCARSDVLCTLFVTASVWAYLEATRRSGRMFSGWLIASILLFVAALLSKASGIVVPALIVMIEVLLRQKGLDLKSVGQRCFAVAARLAPFAIVSFLYIQMRGALLGTTGIKLTGARFADAGDVLSGAGRGIWINLLTQTKCLVVYLKLLIFPKDLSIEHHVDVVTSASDGSFLLALLLVLSILAFVIVTSRGRPLRLVFFLWFLIGLAPTSSIVSLNVLLTERRMYVGGLGSAALVAELFLALVMFFSLRREPDRNPRRKIAVAVGLVLFLCVARITLRIQDWKSSHRLWSAAVEVAPSSDRAQRNLGVARAYRGDFEGAVASFREAVRLYPTYEISHINLGQALQNQGILSNDESLLCDAIAEYEWVLERWPESQVVLHKLAATKVALFQSFGRTNELADVADLYGRILALYPEDETARIALERTLAEMPGKVVHDGEALAEPHVER